MNIHKVPALKVTVDSEIVTIKTLKIYENYADDTNIATSTIQKVSDTHQTHLPLFPPQQSSTPKKSIIQQLPLSPQVLPANTTEPGKDSKKDNITGLIFQPPKFVFNSSTSKLSKTSLMLKTVIGDIPLVWKYDKLRKQMKASRSDNTKCEYGLVVAEVEVKLKLIEEKKRTELKTLEINCIKSATALTLKPKNEEECIKYEKVLTILKYCDALKRELNI